MPRHATTRYAILGMLTRRPMTGYELREEITGSVGHFWSESFGQLYPTLRELAVERLVEGHQSGSRRRIEYRLTDSGHEALRQWLAEDVVQHASGRNELLLKLFFGRHAGPGVLDQHLERHRAALVEALERYHLLERAVEDETDPDRPYWLATVRYGIAVVEAGLAWSAETRSRLDGTTDKPD